MGGEGRMARCAGNGMWYLPIGKSPGRLEMAAGTFI